MSHISCPKVSVITPAYNAENLISRTIESVIDQTFSDWEMIVVDDCSSDSTSKVVEAWARKDSRIQLKTLNKNFGGPAGPRNIGVQAARGDYIAFLDADDIWHPRKLEVQIKVAFQCESDFVCSKMKDFSSEDEVAFSDVASYNLDKISFFQQSFRARIPTSSVLVRKELVTLHPFREEIAYKAVEDYHCWLRILDEKSSCIKIGVPLLFYRKVEGQISGSKLYMMRKVFMVHREYPGRSSAKAVFFTFSHVVGAVYSRLIKKGM
ncbi:glycosyltransferase family 2 protein [Halomonas salifodinae]|uniref:Glycosyltransferase family 2 protein n=1 Tax=Halomonas salifodinae TaxID=438745 RepID=A0ABW2EWX6_9GAMM